MGEKNGDMDSSPEICQASVFTELKINHELFFLIIGKNRKDIKRMQGRKSKMPEITLSKVLRLCNEDCF